MAGTEIATGIHAFDKNGKLEFAQVRGVSSKIYRWENGLVTCFCAWRDATCPGGYWRTANARITRRVRRFIEACQTTHDLKNGGE